MVYFRPALDGRMDGDGNSKLMIYNLERAIRLMPRHSWQYTIVIDCQGTAVVVLFAPAETEAVGCGLILC